VNARHIAKRLALILGSMGVLTAVIGASSFALFTSAATAQSDTFAAGTVTLENTGTMTCTIANLEPGDSTIQYPNSLGAQNDPPCIYAVQYRGTLPAWVALNATIASTAGTDAAACGGHCSPLYNPPDENGLNVLLCGAQPPSNLRTKDLLAWAETVCTDSGAPTGFGIGDNQTLTYSAAYSYSSGETRDVCTGRSGQPAACAADETSAVTNDWRYDLTLDFFLPLTAGNRYQGGTATVTLSLHAVQASNNPLQSCATSTINDPNAGGATHTYLGTVYPNIALNYASPSQPKNGWGQDSGAGSCPTLSPFFHPYT